MKAMYILFIIICLYLLSACSNHDEALLGEMNDLQEVITLVQDKQYNKARDLLYEYKKNSPDNGEYDFWLGNILRKENKLADAKDAYKTAIQKSPKIIESYNNLAALLMMEGSYNQALQTINTALKKQPNHQDLLFKKAQLLFIQKEYQASIDIMEPLVENSKYIDGYRFIGLAYLNIGNKEKALKNLHSFINKFEGTIPEEKKLKQLIEDLEEDVN